MRRWGEKDEVRGVVIKLSWEKIKSKKGGGECPSKDTLMVYTCAFKFTTLLSRSM